LATASFRASQARLRALLKRDENASNRRLVAPISGQVLGNDRLAKHARSIARKHKLLPPAKKQRAPGPLLERLDDTRKVLEEVRVRLNNAAERGLDISPAGDWLLDNSTLSRSTFGK
jgi:hypothetical protein